MNCGACGERLDVVLDLGATALAGAFLARADEPEERFPLRLAVCWRCALVQLADPVDPARMFGEYFYRSSATATGREHFRRYAESLTARFAPQSVLEIGCNDGAMLRHFKAPRVVGVDPSSAAAPGVVPAFFTRQLARGMGTFDLVVANNVLAHVADLHDVLRGVRAVLEGGVFVFEAHSLCELVGRLQYDAIYHEHRYYFGLAAIERLLAQHGLHVFAVESHPLHGGTLRYFADKGARPVQPSVDRQRVREYGLSAALERFAARVQAHRRSMADLPRVAAYGASGRGCMLLQHCQIDAAYVVDDAPVRQGRFTPGTRRPIVPRLAEDGLPLLLTAWTYAQEILPKCHGREVIVPLPEVHKVNLCLA